MSYCSKNIPNIICLVGFQNSAENTVCALSTVSDLSAEMDEETNYNCCSSYSEAVSCSLNYFEHVNVLIY